MAVETPQTPVAERTPQLNRLKMPEIKKAVSRGAEAVRSKNSGWLDKNKQTVPQEDPAIILTEIATQKPDSMLASIDTKKQEIKEAEVQNFGLQNLYENTKHYRNYSSSNFCYRAFYVPDSMYK